MTNKEFFNAYRGEPVLYKGKNIGAYVAGYVLAKQGFATLKLFFGICQHF